MSRAAHKLLVANERRVDYRRMRPGAGGSVMRDEPGVLHGAWCIVPAGPRPVVNSLWMLTITEFAGRQLGNLMERYRWSGVVSRLGDRDE